MANMWFELRSINDVDKVFLDICYEIYLIMANDDKESRWRQYLQMTDLLDGILPDPPFPYWR